jgi:hypothetical protein
MKLETQLFQECKRRDYNCSITYQKINDISIEIYTGHKSTYRLIFYTDGHIESKFAIRKALKFLKEIR